MPSTIDKPLVSAIEAEWDRSVPNAVTIAAREIASRFGDSAQGVLFYGSCLRTGQYEDRILDFYVIVTRYRDAYGSGGLAFANSLIPPNVFYHECDVDGVIVRSKYAVLSLADFHKRCGRSCLNVSVWARFCQPCLLLLPRSDAVRLRILEDIANAVTGMIERILPLLPFGASSEDLWVTAFTQTYRSELRSEKGDKGREIYELDKARYDRLTPLVRVELGIAAEKAPKTQPKRSRKVLAQGMWALRRLDGKLQSLLRLIKASMTFDGGMDYLAWKISRHSGVKVEIQPWMRKVPLIGAPYLAISLRMKGAFR